MRSLQRGLYAAFQYVDVKRGGALIKAIVDSFKTRWRVDKQKNTSLTSSSSPFPHTDPCTLHIIHPTLRHAISNSLILPSGKQTKFELSPSPAQPPDAVSEEISR